MSKCPPHLAGPHLREWAEEGSVLGLNCYALQLEKADRGGGGGVIKTDFTVAGDQVGRHKT
jgi:hypothetical protein